MPDRVRKVAHFNASVPNEPGEGARLLDALRKARVNLLAVWGYPMGVEAQIEMVPEKPAQFVKVAAKAGLRLGPRQEAVLVTGGDRAGAMAEIFLKLAAAGINIGAAQGVATGDGQWGAVLFLPPREIPKAMKALRSRT
jgi:hypothetical protein